MMWVLALMASCWTVFTEMAPYLLFGFLMAGLLSIFISPEWVERHLGGRGLLPIVKAAAFGVPLPLCSCGVIPVTASIRNHGASRGATVGFLLSTPQTGVDSILASYALLGPVIAAYRPVVAFLTGIIGGSIVSVLEPEQSDGGTVSHNTCTEECCAKQPQRPAIVRALHYGFVTLPGDIANALLLGILIAGCISTFLHENFLTQYLGDGIGTMLLMIAVGIPLYVCSTASIPIALGFMHLGVSPGAALAFLIAGPATNAAAIAVVWKLLGRRTTLVYLLSVAFGALAAGLSLDLLFSWLPPTFIDHTKHFHEHGTGWAGQVSAVILLAVLLGSMLQKRMGKTMETATPADHTVVLKVSGMTCSHCVNTVARTLRAISGVDSARVDLERGEAVISGEGLDRNVLAQAVQNLGYEVSFAEESPAPS
jgi:uncharacterized protein